MVATNAAVGARAASATASTLYVSAAAGSDPSCASASQANPFHTIAAALACATNGTTVSVGAGTFDGQGTIDRNITVSGAGAATVIRRPSGLTNLGPDVRVGEGRTVTLRNLTVDGNGQASTGIAAGSGRLTVRDVNVIDNANHETGRGGGISVIPASGTATVLVVDSTIADNAVDGPGGGIYVTAATLPGSSLTVLNSTVAGNQASGGVGHGGGIAVSLSTLTVRDSTVADNQTSSGYGGGVYADVANLAVSLSGTIVAGNHNADPNSGPDCSVAGLRPLSGHHNVIGQNTGVAVSGCVGLDNAVNANIVGTPAAPVDAHLGSLAANGGSTLTRALLSGSPAINTGDPADCQTAPISN